MRNTFCRIATGPDQGGVLRSIESRRFFRGIPPVGFPILLPLLVGLMRAGCLSWLLACSIASAAGLDLSLSQDILDEGRQPPLGEELDREGNSPELSLYANNVKETIKRRTQGAFPRDGARRVICGEVSYAMTLRADGSIERLDVVPVRRNADSSGSLESYFVQSTFAHRHEGAAKYTQTIETDAENLHVFAQAIADLLRSIAPYPARPQLQTSPSGQSGIQSRPKPVLITGGIGVKCTGWDANQ